MPLVSLPLFPEVETQLQRSSCAPCPLRVERRRCQPVGQGPPAGFSSLGGNTPVWELDIYPCLGPDVDSGIVLLSQLCHREDNPTVRQAAQRGRAQFQRFV